MWDANVFGRAVQQARKAQGLTQEQLGEAVGVSGQAVSKWETGESCPDLALLARLCAVLEVSADHLLGTAPSQGFDGLVDALRERLRNAPADQRIRRISIVVGRLLLQYMDERLDAWGGQDFMHVGRRDGAGFGDATLMTRHGGILHIESVADLPDSDIPSEEIAAGLAQLADARVVEVLRRLLVHKRVGAEIRAEAREDPALRGVCDRLVEAGYLAEQRLGYEFTGVGMTVAAVVLTLAAVPGLGGEPRRVSQYITNGL